MKSDGGIYILLDGLVCSIAGYFEESHCIFKIQETSKNIPRYYTLNRLNKRFIVQHVSFSK